MFDKFCRSRSGKSAWRRLHQWSTVTEPHPHEDCAHGVTRRASVRHQSNVESVARMRQQDPTEISGTVPLDLAACRAKLST